MTLGIISAMESELTHLLQDTSYEKTTIGGADFYQATVENTPSVLVVSGIGKTNSAMISTILCTHFKCDKIVFSGVAGGIDDTLNIGDIIISTDAICVDYGRYENGEFTAYQPGNDPFGDNTKHGYSIAPDLKNRITIPNIPNLKPVEGNTPKILWGKVLTGDSFLHCEHRRQQYWQTYNAQAYAMEGASIAQVCERFLVPWIIVRAVSDLAGGNAHFSFEEFLKSTTYNASLVTRHIIKCLGAN